MAEKGIFGGIFDFNRDGEMDAFERAAEFGFLQEMINDDDDNGDFYDNLDDDYDDDDDDDFDGDDWD